MMSHIATAVQAAGGGGGEVVIINPSTFSNTTAENSIITITGGEPNSPFWIGTGNEPITEMPFFVEWPNTLNSSGNYSGNMAHFGTLYGSGYVNVYFGTTNHIRSIPYTWTG